MSNTLCLDAPISRMPRDSALRQLYSNAVLAEIPRIIGSLDRSPLRPTYGCFDRQFWHYRTASFPSEMYQEAVAPLAWAFARSAPGNRWRGCESLREWAIAALRFSARSGHADGSCDDYYPYERALGAAVFSLNASAIAYELLELHDGIALAGLLRRARWVAAHSESGKLANHQALAALALLRVARIADDRHLFAATEERLDRTLAWQHAEGWFAEYDGADPGYQSVTIGCLAEYRALTGRDDLTEPLRRACAFGRWFLSPDGSYGGAYGSRGTFHFYPHGFELLASEDAAAADLADACLAQLERGAQAAFDDDRLFAHRLVSLGIAFEHFSTERATGEAPQAGTRAFDSAGIVVDRHPATHTVVSIARGGVFKHTSCEHPSVSDAGLIVELADSRVGVTQTHRLPAEGHCTYSPSDEPSIAWRVAVQRPLAQCRWETATPFKQAVLHVGMLTLGRWCRGLMRRLLQRRLISAKRSLPIHFTRTFEHLVGDDARLRVTDTLELRSPKLKVARIARAVDFQAAYTAASGVYHDSALQPWEDLHAFVETLNRERRVTIVREYPV